jgi:tetratricopeptide (TPR) repeat protein
MDDEGGDRRNGADPETYRLGPDGTPVDAGTDGPEGSEPETAVEYREAGRRALAGDEYGTARERFDRALELATAAGDDELAAGALLDRGNARLERVGGDAGDPRPAPDAGTTRAAIEDAIADYTAAIERTPSGRAYFNRGLARARLGDREASTTDLERAAERGEGQPFLVRGNAYAEAGADEAARDDFTRAIERTDAARAYSNRGNANRRLGDVAAAREDYAAALDRATELPDGGRRVLVELAGVDDRAATHRVRAAFLAVTGRDLWRGVSLADAALPDADSGTPTWSDAAALVVAGEALREAAGYGRDAAVEADVSALRSGLAAADLPMPTAALVRATAGDDTEADPFETIGALETPDDLAGAVADRDDRALRAAAVAEFGRQLRLYR